MLGAVMFGHREMQTVIDAIIRLAEKAAKEPRDARRTTRPATCSPMCNAPRRERPARGLSRSPASRSAITTVDASQGEASSAASRPRGRVDTRRRSPALFKDVEAEIVRGNIIETGTRIDGRDLKTVRPIVCEVGVLPRTHGSALFTRGETQALVVTTLGTGEDEQYHRFAGRRRTRSLPAALQLPALFGGRDRPHAAAPAAARSAMASSPGAPSIRCCPTRTSSPTRSASCRRSPNPTARPRWRPSAAPRSH